MDLVLPVLENKITAMVTAFRFVVFAMLVAGLIARMSRQHYTNSEIVRPLARAITIVALVSSMNWWFPLVENTMLAAASYLDPQYNDNPARASEELRAGITLNPEKKEWSWRKLNESLYNAVTDAVSWVFIQIGALISAPMIILQYILRWILYLLTPFALACFMIPGATQIGVRFFQQVLAVLAWPVGFAITNLVTIAIWQDFRSVVGVDPASLEMAAYSPFLTNIGGILAALTLLIGTISTPIICQKIFAQGYAFTGEAGNPGALGKSGMDVLYRANMVGNMLAPRAGAVSAMAAQANGASSSTSQSNVAPPPSPAPSTPGL
ncbi:hypothetical protein M2447_002646 [Ereboglobus sp. PH5-10]|uniref:hypothetical protein n=1 Tax=Ereboglobus sp. PH5-10 TaxID=2940629 RepID=UPI002405EAF2|nr:hypothetical protein [Ereboglobus sp. PH5-10]MDF9828522.1 hypothetical protein [Ereboglobus sp. PH5-10]